MVDNNELQSNLEKLIELDKQIEWHSFSNHPIPIPVAEVIILEEALNTPINPAFKQIIMTVGCNFIGLDLTRFQDILKNTNYVRENYTDVERHRVAEKSLAISDDGTGNPILLDESGQLYIFYHDDIDFEQLPESLEELLSKHVKWLEEHKGVVRWLPDGTPIYENIYVRNDTD